MMRTSTSLSPPYLSVSDVLAAVDERYNNQALHDEVLVYLEKGELPQETETWEDAVLLSLSRPAILCSATRRKRTAEFFWNAVQTAQAAAIRRQRPCEPHGVTPRRNCRPCMAALKEASRERKKQLVSHDDAQKGEKNR